MTISRKNPKNLRRNPSTDLWEIRKLINGTSYFYPCETKCEIQAIGIRDKKLTEWEEIENGNKKKEISIADAAELLISANSIGPKKDQWSKGYIKGFHDNVNKLTGDTAKQNRKKIPVKFVSQITANILDDHKNQRLVEGMAIGTISNELAMLKRVVIYAGIKNYAVPDPTLLVWPNVPSNAQRERILTKEEVDKIRYQLRKKPNDLAVFEILHAIGARKMEVYKMTLNNINLVDRTFKIKRHKNNTLDSFPMSEKVFEILSRIKNDPDHDVYVFPNQQGTSHRSRSNYWFEQALKRAEINSVEMLDEDLHPENFAQNICIHSIRHYVGHTMARSGMYTLSQIGNYLGHRSLKSTERYAKSLKDDGQKQNMMNLMGDL